MSFSSVKYPAALSRITPAESSLSSAPAASAAYPPSELPTMTVGF